MNAARSRGAHPGEPGHRNALSGRSYRGINLLVLAITALEQGFEDARWLTFRQALARGGHVRRGEHGTQVVLWKWLEREEQAGSEQATRRPLLRLFTVFNAEQCDDLALPSPVGVGTFDPLERAEAIVAGYAGGPSLHYDAENAYYSPLHDAVHLPPRGAFLSTHGYYATLFHELAHSSGHRSRLARAGFEAGIAPFGSELYSREELVAEFAAAFLCHEAGVELSSLEQSAAYIASWLRALRDDRRMVVVAAGQGQRTADHILGRTPEIAGSEPEGQTPTNGASDDDRTE